MSLPPVSADVQILPKPEVVWIEGWFRRASIDRKLKNWFNGKALPVKMRHGRTYGNSPKLIQISTLRTRTLQGWGNDMNQNWWL
jgi:hypothetical protein